MTSIVTWTGKLEAIYSRQSGGQLAWLYNPTRVVNIPADCGPYSQRTKLVKADELLQITDAQIMLFLDRDVTSVPKKLKEITTKYLSLLRAAVQSDWERVTSLALNAVELWVEGIRDGELDGWTSAGMSSIISFSTDVVDKQIQPSDDLDTPTDQSAALQKLLNGVRKHIGKFRGCENDVNHIGAYTILLSESIRLCLKLNNPPMATSFLKSVPTQQPLPPRSQRGPATRFKFYYANLMLQKEMFESAIDPLEWAAVYCPSRHIRLKNSIFACLIAAKMRLGFSPPPSVLENNNLEHYYPIVQALHSGDLNLFDQAMEMYSNRYYEEGTTLCLSKVRFIVQQILCKRVHRWLQKHFYKPGHPSNVVDLCFFTCALKTSAEDEEIDDEETMCVLAHLIQLGYVKGYIAWQQKKLVLSKVNPFPLLDAKSTQK